MSLFQPVYIDTYNSGLLGKKIKHAREILKSCTLCPRKCKVDRLSGETGICKTAGNAYVSSYDAHFGEEVPLVGKKGSGTIFMAYCGLMCNFCQNFEISHKGYGQEVDSSQIAYMMMDLQKMGCHNINFVTPTHVVPQILGALEIAIEDGLTIPLVYNSSGYEDVETLKLLDGIMDIYMPDFKFWDPDVSEKTCKARDYPEKAREAVSEMHCQVGDLVVDESGIARRGLLVRHLVLPGGLAGTREIMRFIARIISTNTYVNVMSQYRPCGNAYEVEELTVSLSTDAFEKAVYEALDEGITRIDNPGRFFGKI